MEQNKMIKKIGDKYRPEGKDKIKNAVKKIQDLYMGLAKKYLNEKSILKQQIK